MEEASEGFVSDPDPQARKGEHIYTMSLPWGKDLAGTGETEKGFVE